MAIVLTLGLAISASYAAEGNKKLASQIEIEGTTFDNPDITFIGDVHVRKNKCERGRTVVLRYTGPNPPREIGTATTDHTGDWQVSEDASDLDGGDYVADVKRRKFGPAGKKVTCRKATSPPFLLD